MTTIALLTDFGTRDPYVAAMKGVIASRCPASIVDLTHEIAPFDVWEAAFFLRDVIAYWPVETIFVCVVDPGVGSERRIIAVKSEGQIFLAPDNGLLHFVDGDVHDVTNESLFLPNGSTTFHGRDRFAPVAAALANGFPLGDLGARITDRISLDYTPGAIIRIDRFGNCITDFVPPPGPFAVLVNDQRIDDLRTTYSGDGPFAIIGSTGCIEISVAGNSAASLLHLSRGDRVTIVPK
jgi:S-adenosylmethionine hydrolase